MIYDNIVNDLLENCWLRTWTNKKFNYETFNEDDIDIRDIAHHLSLECRFSGACKFHYSVGYHSILGLDYIREDAKLAYQLHDATETYIKDIPRPLKNWLRMKDCTIIDELEDKIFNTICRKFNVKYNKDIKQEVKRVDNLMYLNEKCQVQNTDFVISEKDKLPFTILPVDPLYIEKLFLEKFYKLVNN